MNQRDTNQRATNPTDTPARSTDPTGVPDFDGLVAAVHDAAVDPSPLRRLAAATDLSSALIDHADALLGHFVEACRKDGHSWSDIGQVLGVSKQAVQKRFIEMPLGRVTPRTRNVLDAAAQLARDQGAGAVRLDHLALAVFAEPESIGARVLGDLGVTETDLDRAIGEKTRRRGANLSADTPPDQAVLASALALGHNYVGTEHIVLACHRDPESLMSEVLDDLGAPADAIERAVRAALEPLA